MNKIKLGLVIGVAVGLSACSGGSDVVKKTTNPPEVEIVQGDEVASNDEENNDFIEQGNAIPNDDGSIFQGFDDPANPLSTTTIYFDFDQSYLRTEFDASLAAHATFLANHPSESVVFEGYGDERGTREYNLALGERRGLSVEDYFLVNGVSQGQMETVSYGEENPAEEGSDEASWALNRRVRIVYLGR